MITENFICFITGDYSSDGHEKIDHTYVKCNMTDVDIKECYNRACEKVGFNLIEDYCNSYENSSLPKEIVDKLMITFPEIKEYFNGDDFDEDDSEMLDFGFQCYPELWVDVYLLMVKNINPNFEYEFLSDSVANIYIGGYGLYF